MFPLFSRHVLCSGFGCARFNRGRRAFVCGFDSSSGSGSPESSRCQAARASSIMSRASSISESLTFLGGRNLSTVSAVARQSRPISMSLFCKIFGRLIQHQLRSLGLAPDFLHVLIALCKRLEAGLETGACCPGRGRGVLRGWFLSRPVRLRRQAACRQRCLHVCRVEARRQVWGL